MSLAMDSPNNTPSLRVCFFWCCAGTPWTATDLHPQSLQSNPNFYQTNAAAGYTPSLCTPLNVDDALGLSDGYKFDIIPPVRISPALLSHSLVVYIYSPIISTPSFEHFL